MGSFCPPVLTNGPVRYGTVKQTERFRAKNKRSGCKRTVIKRLHCKETVIERLDRSLNDYIIKRTVIERFEWSLNDYNIKRTVIKWFLGSFLTGFKPVRWPFITGRSTKGAVLSQNQRNGRKNRTVRGQNERTGQTNGPVKRTDRSRPKNKNRPYLGYTST